VQPLQDNDPLGDRANVDLHLSSAFPEAAAGSLTPQRDGQPATAPTFPIIRPSGSTGT